MRAADGVRGTRAEFVFQRRDEYLEAVEKQCVGAAYRRGDFSIGECADDDRAHAVGYGSGVDLHHGFLRFFQTVDKGQGVFAQIQVVELRKQAVAESGYPEFQSGIWYGVIAPARTPPDTIARLNAELVKIIRTPDFLASLRAEGADVIASTPEVFGEHIRRETARWAAVIKEAKIITNRFYLTFKDAS